MHILVRYGEIGLKSSQVRGQFEQRLRDNLSRALDARDIEHDMLEREGRIFARVDEDAAADAALFLSWVPGVVSASPVETATTLDLDAMADTAVSLVDETVETFAVDARRAGEHDFSSDDIEEVVGQAIVDRTGLDVDLDDPDVTVHVEARYQHAYLYTVSVDGIGGLPVDVERGVVVHLADRAATVAAYQLLRRGIMVYPVYTGNDPDAVEQDIRTLQQFDPRIKLTTMTGKEADKAVTDAAALYGCEAVAYGDTVEDIEDVEHDPPLPVLQPNSGMADEDVLDVYADILYHPV